MKIDKTFKIKEKDFNYFVKNGIVSTKLKSFVVRYKPIEPNSIVKLECENGRYIIFQSGMCAEYWWYINEAPKYLIDIDKILKVKQWKNTLMI